MNTKKLFGAFIVTVTLMSCANFISHQSQNYRAVKTENSANSKALIASQKLNEDKIENYANPKAFITSKQLNALKEQDANMVIIGVLNPLKFHKPISGSFTLWRDDYSAAKEAYPYSGMRNTVKKMAAILSKYGVNKDTTIVVYSADYHHDAGRLYWQLKLLGHENVKILDGGLNAWVEAGYATGDANPTVKKTEYVVNNIHQAHLADIEMVKAAIDNDEWIILDVRTPEEDEGKETKRGAFGPGRIPDSVFIPWSDAVNEDTRLKTLEELKEIYGDYKDKKVIVYCQSGVRSAFTTIVLTEVLGFQNVYNYDGSWIEWSYEHYEKGTVEIEKG